MGPIVVIGEELQVVGFRLAGVVVHSPAPDALAATFERASASAGLVVLSRRSADALPPALLHEARRRVTPPVVVMPDIAAPAGDDGLVRRLNALLGIEG